MSDTINIGGIMITIGGTSDQLKSQLTQVQKLFNQTQSAGAEAFDGISLKGVAAALGIGLAFDKVKDAIESTIDAADDLGKAAQRFGVNVDVFGKFEAAAQSADVSVEALTNSLRFLTQQISQPAESDAGRTFAALGVSVKNTDGTLKDSVEVFKEVSDALNKYGDGTNKATIEAQLFGRQWQEVAAFIAQGRTGIDALGDAASKSGNAIDKDLTTASKKFNDTITDIKANVQGGLNELTKELLPDLQDIAQAFKDSTEKGTTFRDMMHNVADVLKLIYTGAISVWTSLEIVGSMFDTIAHSAYDAITGDFNAATLEMMQGAMSVQADWGQARNTINQIWGKDIPTIVAAGVDKVNSLTKNANVVPNYTSQGFADDVDSKSKPQAPHVASADEISRQMTVIQQTSKGLNDELTRMETLLGIQGKNVDQNSASWQQYDAAAQAAAQRLQQIEQIDLNNILNDEAISTYTEKWNALTAAVQKGTISVQQYDQMNKKLHDDQVQNLEDVASQTAQTITDVFGQNKTAAIASAIINTAVGVTKALTGAPPPYNFALAALVAASGAAQIATIRSTSQSGGGGTGASPSSGGASAGAAAAQAPAAAAAPQQTLTVMGINRNQMFAGDAVRDLAQRLIDFQKDGGRVVLA